MRITQRDAAAIIAGLERIDDERQRILDILFPDVPDVPDAGDEREEPSCLHPDEELEDRSTMGEERYHCRACGAAFDHHPRTTHFQE